MEGTAQSFVENSGDDRPIRNDTEGGQDDNDAVGVSSSHPKVSLSVSSERPLASVNDYEEIPEPKQVTAAKENQENVTKTTNLKPPPEPPASHQAPQQQPREKNNKRKRSNKLLQDCLSVEIPLGYTADLGVAWRHTRPKRVAELVEFYPFLRTVVAVGGNKADDRLEGKLGDPDEDDEEEEDAEDEGNERGNGADASGGEENKPKKKKAKQKVASSAEKKKNIPIRRNAAPNPRDFSNVVDYLEAKYARGVMVDDGLLLERKKPNANHNNEGELLDDDDEEEKGSVYSETASWIDDSDLKRDVAEQVLAHTTTTKLELTTDDSEFFVNVGTLEVEETEQTKDWYDPLKDVDDRKNAAGTTSKSSARSNSGSSHPNKKTNTTTSRNSTNSSSGKPRGSSGNKKANTAAAGATTSPPQKKTSGGGAGTTKTAPSDAVSAKKPSEAGGGTKSSKASSLAANKKESTSPSPPPKKKARKLEPTSTTTTKNEKQPPAVPEPSKTSTTSSITSSENKYNNNKERSLSAAAQTQAVVQDTAVTREQAKIEAEKKSAMKRAYVTLVTMIKGLSDDEIPRRKTKDKVALTCPADKKPGDSILFENPHVKGQRLKVKIPKNTLPGGIFKVTVPVPPEPAGDDEEGGEQTDYNRWSREFYETLSDYAYHYDVWIDAVAERHVANNNKEYSGHFEKRKKFDDLVEVFPKDLKTPIDKAYMQKILRRARQNKHKRDKTAKRLEERAKELSSSSSIVPSQPPRSSENNDPDDPLTDGGSVVSSAMSGGGGGGGNNKSSRNQQPPGIAGISTFRSTETHRFLSIPLPRCSTQFEKRPFLETDFV